MYHDHLHWLLIGAAIGPFIIFFARRSLALEKWLLSGMLVAAAFWYLQFGILSGADMTTLQPQMLGAIAFTILGVLGITRSLLYPGIGWVAHSAWDFASPFFSDVTYMPEWGAPVCFGFDAIIGVYMIVRAFRAFPLAEEQTQDI